MQEKQLELMRNFDLQLLIPHGLSTAKAPCNGELRYISRDVCNLFAAYIFGYVHGREANAQQE